MLMLTGQLPYRQFTEHAACSQMLYWLFCCTLSGQLPFIYTACATRQPMDAVPACCGIPTSRLSPGLGWQSLIIETEAVDTLFLTDMT